MNSQADKYRRRHYNTITAVVYETVQSAYRGHYLILERGGNKIALQSTKEETIDHIKQLVKGEKVKVWYMPFSNVGSSPGNYFTNLVIMELQSDHSKRLARSEEIQYAKSDAIKPSSEFE